MNWGRKLFEFIRDIGVAPPRYLMTDGGTGPNRRLRVDVGQTGFFAGREFRTFKKFTAVASGTTYVIKVVVPINIILFGLTVNATKGVASITSKAGGTEGGSFSETLPIIVRNGMSERPFPYYTPKVVITAGGTHSDGLTLDELLVSTSGQGNQAGNVGVTNGDERGIAAGTYYIIVVTSGSEAFTATLNAWWEERP